MASEDQFRHYFPLMRRVIILVAVLTAVPVILWTITVFVRGYFGPPKIPTPKPVATASAEAPPGAAAGQEIGARPSSAPQQAKASDTPLPIVEARASATDARSIAPAAKGSMLGDRPAGNDAGPPAAAASAATMALAVSANGDARAARGAIGAPAGMSDAATPSTGALAPQQPIDAAQSAADDVAPAGEPLAGPVPLPRQRPRYAAMMQNGVPMPRPRPDAAGPAGAETSATPLGWLQKMFQQQ